ncbi:hypothetical protein RRG08_044849 [Elysia crispata]|uniref:Uncharacterized protein n=1 Tax=Elysia crispata TaxID=231223 RepID=A0AAE1A3E7_9GAST|nr:hypothetical protein RRG08_044849 [Elysia crispata]
MPSRDPTRSNSLEPQPSVSSTGHARAQVFGLIWWESLDRILSGRSERRSNSLEPQPSVSSVGHARAKVFGLTCQVVTQHGPTV